MVDYEDLRERMARVETKLENIDARHAEIRQALRDLTHRFNRFVMTLLTALGSALLGLFGWLIKKLGG